MHAVASGEHASTPFTKSATLVRGGGHAKSKTWVNGQATHSNTPSPAPEGRWERGRSSRGLKRGGRSGHDGHARHPDSRISSANVTEDELESEAVNDEAADARLARFADPHELSGANGTIKTWDQLVKEREEERVRAIREGKMDDPNKRKRLDELITIVGTCQDMCPEFERYRRERENNLDRWECILDAGGRPTKKVDHQKAVKIYERGQGDKIIPSDLRPAPVLKRTLDYLFYDLIPRGGFDGTQAFVRDRSRAVRNDFTIQSDHGPVAMECHERCARFHIISLHLLYGHANFDRALEIQQLMNSLLSLKEYYDDQRATYESENELEMRIYHRLGLIRDQHERNDRPPPHIAADPAFQLVTRFRSEVQAASSPITKTSQLRVSTQAMATFSELLGVLQKRNNQVMMVLVACFLEHIFGPETIDDFEGIRGDLSVQNIIDGISLATDESNAGNGNGYLDADMVYEGEAETGNGTEEGDDMDAFIDEDFDEAANVTQEADVSVSVPPSSVKSPFVKSNGTLSGITDSKSAAGVFGGLSSAPSSSQSVFGQIVNSSSTPNIFGNTGSSVFGKPTSAFSVNSSGSNVFGGPVFGAAQSNVDVSSSSPRQTPSKPAVQSSAPKTSLPASVAGSGTKNGGSLADAAPLSTAGEEDKLPPSDLGTFPQKTPPFASSKSTTFLNAEAPAFEPSFKASSSVPAMATSSRASLTPLRTDSHSLLQNAVDPNRRALPSSIMSPGLTFPLADSRSPLFINTNSPSPSKVLSGATKGQAVDSPLGPPPLHRKNIISLPGTPTGSFTSAFPIAGPSTPSTPYHFPGLQINVSATTTSAPSPTSPSTTLLHRPSDSATPFQSFSAFSSASNGKGKEPETESETKFIDKEELKTQANDFRAHSVLVKGLWRRWRSKASEALAWKEACRRSEEYKQRLLQQSPGIGMSRSPLLDSASNGALSSLPSSSSFKRQRSSSSLQESESGRSRRRKRISNGDVLMRTDEELTERLMKNKEQHDRRWAKGSFVRIIRERIQGQAGEFPNDWMLWLCLNGDNEKTAIWLQQKFDVPNSGQWSSEFIFVIPISDTPADQVFPGVVVFECTSLEEVDDEFERKYRVLDDLTRLREIVKGFKEDDHYLPSIVLICWDSSIHEDIVRSVECYIDDGKLYAYTTVILSSDDPDTAFAEGLRSLDLDTQGELVDFLTLADLFDDFNSLIHDSLSIWLEACAADEKFHWTLFCHVFIHYVEVLNALIRIGCGLWYPETSKRVPSFAVPSFPPEKSESSVSSAIRSWLSITASDSSLLAYVSALDFSQSSESLAFFDHLARVARDRVDRKSANERWITKAIPKASLQRFSTEFEQSLEETSSQLRKISASLPRPSTRRNPQSKDHFIDKVNVDDSISRQTSPVARHPHPIPSNSYDDSQPRIVLTASSPPPPEHTANGSFEAPSSPTLSNAPSIASTTTQVTLQMLRALSRDVLNNYGPKEKKRSRRSL